MIKPILVHKEHKEIERHQKMVNYSKHVTGRSQDAHDKSKENSEKLTPRGIVMNVLRGEGGLLMDSEG